MRSKRFFIVAPTRGWGRIRPQAQHHCYGRRAAVSSRIRSIIPLFFATGLLFLSTASFAQVGISIRIAPPPLPVYEQPICPGDGYIWTPGYWGWSDDYYWVPGTWVFSSGTWIPMDSGILGLGRQRIYFQ